jgi:hypothetical protein
VVQKSRDDFSEKTKQQIAKRAGWLCSFPGCHAMTIGATADGQSEINIGTAAHICAAAPGGPRFDAKMSSSQRSDPSNGIWLCRDHGKAIDSDDRQFTVELLRAWKASAQELAMRRVLANQAPPSQALLLAGTLISQLRSAAATDLAIFRKKSRWPCTSVALSLRVDGYNGPVTTQKLASLLKTFNDLILVAPPGMGKTTTLLQVAHAILESNSGIPIVVPLGEWATENMSILDSIMGRSSFRSISQNDFRSAAADGGIALLLDGWNELDATTRKRARIQIETLKAEIPAIALMVSTRKQVFDVPFPGNLVELLPLDDAQQVAIAKELCGDTGVKIVDEAWRIAGLRELVPIPLYLTALLTSSSNTPFATTKEEVLGRFVAAHEMVASNAEVLHDIARGFQQDFLVTLATFATQAASTAISDSDARRLISGVTSRLMAAGQLGSAPDPSDVLEVLVSNHVLTRIGDTVGISFQHQQFQEWYASHLVARRILADVSDTKGRELLKAEFFNLISWEESILFAVERMACGTASERVACGEAILAAFEVDPMLSAEMIYRATDQIWASIATNIKEKILRWHAPGKSDRALRFMINSGRSDFFRQIWPLITHKNEQVSLEAIRNCKRFRCSVLGPDAATHIRALPTEQRRMILEEIIMRSGMDGLDLSTSIAKTDPDPNVQASVVEALAFRRADRHLADLLRDAKDDVFDLVARSSLVKEIGEESLKLRLSDARKRHGAGMVSAYDRLREVLFDHGDDNREAELTTVIAEMESEDIQGPHAQLVYEARRRYPRAIAEGMLLRLRAGHPLVHGADEILASAGFSIEDEAVLQIALATTVSRNRCAEAAASVLGPRATSRMLDALLNAASRLHGFNGVKDKSISDRYHDLQARIGHVPGASLITAVESRSALANNEEMARMAELLARHPEGRADPERPFDNAERTAIQKLVKDWGHRLLASDNSERWQLASIMMLASRAPNADLLPTLKILLDENLRRFRAFRAEAIATGQRQGKALNEARWPMMHEYQRAFLAIDAPETATLMREYLTEPDFGAFAAGVLAAHWEAANVPAPDRRFFGGVNFRHVANRRAARVMEPDATSVEAEWMFGAIESLIADGASDIEKKLAVSLGIVAVRLPHGNRATTIKRLYALSNRRERSSLLLNQTLAGVEIDSHLVLDGIDEILNAAKTKPWMLMQNDGYELREWLRLLPFTNRPTETLPVVRGLPPAQREPRFLEEIINCLAEIPSIEGEEVLFGLAEDDRRFYMNHGWRNAALRLGTESAARRLVDLTAVGVFGTQSVDGHWSREFGALISEFPAVREYVYGLLRDEAVHWPLLQVISEYPDVEGLLILIGIENKHNCSVVTRHTIETFTIEQIPVDSGSSTYQLVPNSCSELRKRLLAITKDGGMADAAARCLNAIDLIRDEIGQPLAEPRHPDLTSDRQWPMIPTSNPKAGG